MFALRQELRELGILELKLDVLVEIILISALTRFRSSLIGACLSALGLFALMIGFPWLAPPPERNGGDG